jgi:hypothetical protein
MDNGLIKGGKCWEHDGQRMVMQCMGFYEQLYLHSAVAISWKVKIYFDLHV